MNYLSDKEFQRYDRQIKIFGIEAQKKLKKSKVTIIGLGGLGSASATYLAALGVGNLRLVDKEKVELSNLNRQVIHWTTDIGKLKTLSAFEKLSKLNPEINIETLNLGVTEENVHEIIKDSDLVMDALDNWKTRFIVNDACVQDKIPFIHAGVREFQGQVFVVKPREGACLRCLLPKIPKEERDVPVVGPIVGVVALIQTVEALKLLTGFGQPQISTLLFYDARIQGIEKIKVKKSQKCPVCSKFG